MRRTIFVFAATCIFASAAFGASSGRQSSPAFKALSIGSGTLTRVYPRVFTPNDDGKNDVVIFEFDNPAVLPLSGEVFDGQGARVGTLASVPSSEETMLTWDGKRNGRSLPSGVYIYKVKVGDASGGGTVVLAR